VVGFGASLAFVAAACSKKTTTSGASGPASASASAAASPSASGSAAADLPILSYALTLEQLEANFYTQGAVPALLSGRELAIAQAIKAHELAHVASLSSAIQAAGGTPAAAPTFVFPAGTFTDRAQFLKTASTFEELGVAAYHGQVAVIKTPAILGAAASIAGVESRHAAILATLNAGTPFPAPIESRKDMATVLAAAKPFIKS
jgi:Ferritin-like domain